MSKLGFDIIPAAPYGAIMTTPRPHRPSRKPARKPADGATRRAVPKAVPKATTVRLQVELLAGLALLQRILKKPMNRMINEAVRSYVERQSSQVEADLQQVLERVKAYRRSDPGYRRLWAEFVDAEARHGKDDPVEGRIKSAGPVQAKVRDILSR
jgi:hypothetical protein